MIALDGVLAGLAHVASGPDHLAGVAPLAADGRRRRAAAAVGARWGLGHGLGVALMGAAGQVAVSVGALEATSAWSERLVGLMLIGLGCVALRRARTATVHRHDGAALGLGLLHGLAGAGHFWAVLPSLAMRGADAFLYLVSYLVASVLAMVTFSYALGSVSERCGARTVPRLLCAAGVASITVGVFWTWVAWSG